MKTDQGALDRVKTYLSRRPAALKRYLGGGTDGTVWETSKDTAVKAFARQAGFINERDAYLRLREWGAGEQIDGFWVPGIIDWDDELLVVEMDMVHDPPYIIDFAKAWINFPPDFSPEVLAEDDRRIREEFGHNYSKVKSLLRALEGFRIFYSDAKRGNIAFPDMP